MVEHQVAHHGLGHLLRSRDGGLSLAGGEALDFDDVATLSLYAAGHLVKSVLCILAQHGLASAEADFGLVRGLVLVDVADHVLDRLHPGGYLLRGILRLGGFVAGVYGVLVSFVRLVRSQLDASGSARIDVLDLLAVLRSQLIEFIDAVPDGLGLPLYVVLAGERIDASPEAFTGRSGQRSFAGGVAAAVVGRLRLLRVGRLALVLGGLR